MQEESGKNPFFRKQITPWYDSDFVCRVLIAVMIIVFAFAIAGVLVSSGNPNFEKHIWFPSVLAFLSLFLVVKIFLRLQKRSNNS